jgi:ADP-ribose pyrophosphatase
MVGILTSVARWSNQSSMITEWPQPIRHLEQQVDQNTEFLFQGKRFQVVRMTQVSGDGTKHQRDIIVHSGSVVVLPLLGPEKICLIRNDRVAVGETLIELPAGTLETGEDPLEAARRELAEETGYRAGRLEKLSEFYMSPGILRERMHLYLATELTAGPEGREPGEEIENLLVSWREAMEMVQSGAIYDAKTLVGLLFYDRFRRQPGSTT